MSSPQSLITQVSEEDGVAAFDEEEEQPVGCMARVFPCFRRNRKARATPLPVHRSTAQQVPTEEQKPVDVPGDALLPAQFPGDSGKICLVLDLDETLVHSSFKPVPDADFVVPIEIEGQTHQVYVAKRPHVDKFLKRMGDLFEVVIFTASLAKYADPVSDLLDIHHVIRYRLFREHCSYHMGNFVKDMRRMGRDIRKTVIVDNAPASYMFTPENAVAVTSWFSDPNDTELLDLIPFFEDMARAGNVYHVLGKRRS
eukprot:m.108168 g.108168  ORF g.108168 m.108168 type:complete len:255 (+) comp51725_c0_seq1:102-866(+)